MRDAELLDMVAGCLAGFRLVRYRFMLRLLEPALLDGYLGNMLHGLLKTALYNTACDHPGKGGTADGEGTASGSAQYGARGTGWVSPRAELCSDCERNLRRECAYGYCMETVAFTGRPDGSANHPHPYVLEPPPPRKPNRETFSRDAKGTTGPGGRHDKWGQGYCKYEAGEAVPFNLVLVGRGIDFIDPIIRALKEGGELGGIGIHTEKRKTGRPKYVLEMRGRGGAKSPACSKVGKSGPGEAIFFKDLVTELHEDSPCRMELRFVTPTHIQAKGGRYTNRFDFDIFMGRLLGRIGDLSMNHCGEEFDYDFLRPGIEKVKTTYCEFEEHEWPRASSRHGKMTHWGITGRVVIEGRIAPYVPFIRLGEYIHVGNMTSFGWGQYEICSID